MLSSSDALLAHIPVHGQVLKGAAFGLRNQESGENTSKHEGGEDLHDVVEPWAGVVLCSAAGTEGGDSALSDDGTNLARTGRDTVGG